MARTVRKKKKMMVSMEMESKGMENEAISGAQKEKKQVEAVRSSQQKSGTKQLKKLLLEKQLKMRKLLPDNWLKKLLLGKQLKKLKLERRHPLLAPD